MYVEVDVEPEFLPPMSLREAASPTEECCEKCFCNKSHGSGSKIGHCENLDCSCHQKEQPYCKKCGHPKNMGKTSRCEDAFHFEEQPKWSYDHTTPSLPSQNANTVEEQPKCRKCAGENVPEHSQQCISSGFEEPPKCSCKGKIQHGVHSETECHAEEQPKECRTFKETGGNFCNPEEHPKCGCNLAPPNMHFKDCTLREEQPKCRCTIRADGRWPHSDCPVHSKNEFTDKRYHDLFNPEEHPEKPKVITKLDEGSWVDPRRESTELRAKINELVDALSALTKSQ